MPAAPRTRTSSPFTRPGSCWKNDEVLSIESNSEHSCGVLSCHSPTKQRYVSHITAATTNAAGTYRSSGAQRMISRHRSELPRAENDIDIGEDVERGQVSRRHASQIQWRRHHTRVLQRGLGPLVLGDLVEVPTRQRGNLQRSQQAVQCQSVVAPRMSRGGRDRGGEGEREREMEMEMGSGGEIDDTRKRKQRHSNSTGWQEKESDTTGTHMQKCGCHKAVGIRPH
jgi:hypothetical protein